MTRLGPSRAKASTQNTNVVRADGRAKRYNATHELLKRKEKDLHKHKSSAIAKPLVPPHAETNIRNHLFRRKFGSATFELDDTVSLYLIAVCMCGVTFL